MITAGEISAIFPHHLLKLPAQFFVKPRVIGEQKQIGLAHLRHIPAQVFHHPPSQAFPSKSGLHIHSAHIWGQIRPGVKIIFNDPHFSAYHRQARSAHRGFSRRQSHCTTLPPFQKNAAEAQLLRLHVFKLR